MNHGRGGGAVANSIAILETVAECGVGVTAKEIAQRLELSPATAYRLLNTLVADEYLIRTADLRGFGLGVRLRGLAAALNSPTLPSAAREQLAEFRGSTRFAVHLMGFRAATVVVVGGDPDNPVRGERELGRNLHASAAGKLLLATRTQWRELVPAPVRLTDRTVVEHSALADEIRTIRRSGYARSVGELVPGLACLAYPIHGENGVVEGALCLAGPSNRIDALEDHDEPARRYAARLGPLIY
ncbi:IclR family transcriptional regulator [Nocardia stercoris]|uniref:IclR family transcriptional regulator n=1 Tax=Nocardia stercoris TaxID=2483361 RepID=A0A3M2L226_9NOCA|nr:IclR family transcriptional regulator [Nocardia stercoris]RMI30573.1 IclR family transcriptional regulator [Nocardia stercoris]